MKSLRSITGFAPAAGLIFLALFTLPAQTSSAQAPEYISVQGQIVDGSGEPLTGYHTMRVRLFTEGSGTPIYDETQSGTTYDRLSSFHPTLSPLDGHRLERSAEPCSTLLAGVYATKPGVVLSASPLNAEKAEQQIPLGVLGVIPTKVCLENGPIDVGDLLVTSSRPGHAMRGERGRLSFGMGIGKAMDAFSGAGCGTIDVLVNVK